MIKPDDLCYLATPYSKYEGGNIERVPRRGRIFEEAVAKALESGGHRRNDRMRRKQVRRESKQQKREDKPAPTAHCPVLEVEGCFAYLSLVARMPPAVRGSFTFL